MRSGIRRRFVPDIGRNPCTAQNAEANSGKTPTSVPSAVIAPPQEAPKALLLDKRNRKIAGVCAGFARYLNLDVVVIRVLWLGLAICTGGMGLLAYLAAWIIMPSDGGLESREAIMHQP